jgi:hypothetical protein
MTIPVHVLNLYQKPALGTTLLSRIQTYNYKHSINAIGGFDTASCDIAIRSRDEGQQFLDQYLGNRVAIYVDNPIEPVWEGFINRMSFNGGGAAYTIGLDEMANRLAVTYTDNAGSIISSALVSDTNSQATFGIKNDRLELQAQNTGTTAIAAIRDTSLAQRAWPKTSVIPGQGSSGLLRIEMLGFYHTLNWDVYQDATVANVTLSNYLINQLLPGVSNGATFFDNTVTTGITTNALTIQRTSIRGNTIWDRMMVIRESGDATNYYVIGITPTNFQTGVRSLYYRVFNPTIVYTARQSDGLRVRNLYGQIVPPWMVRPDNGIRISDMLIGWDGIGDNPTETWIMGVDYDANRQSVMYQGDDDLTAEGAFNFRRQNKAFGKKFGAQYRV